MYYLEFRDPITPNRATKIAFWCLDLNMKFAWSFEKYKNIDGYSSTMYTGLFLPDEKDAMLLKLTFNV